MAKFSLVTFLLITLCGCGGDDTPTAKSNVVKESAVLKVKVFSDGLIVANEKKVEIDQLAEEMSKLKKSGGTVWYYREAADSEPHQNAIRVMQLVVDNRLPITMSTSPDFSNVVGPDGIPRPR